MLNFNDVDIKKTYAARHDNFNVFCQDIKTRNGMFNLYLKKVLKILTIVELKTSLQKVTIIISQLKIMTKLLNS